MVERLLSFRSRRFMLLLLVVVLAFAPVMRAYGDDYEGGGGASSSFNSNFGTVWYGPTGTGGIANTLYVRYGVVANTQYDAALYCCRGSNFDLSDLSATKKYKLLNNGDFTQFANLFKVGKPEETDDWRGDANVVFAWNSARQMYGETFCYSALYTNDQKIRAQDAINRIMAESDEPSGGGNTGSGLSELPDDVTMYYTGNSTHFMGDSFVWHLSDSDKSYFTKLMTDQNMHYAFATLNEGMGDFNFWICDQDFEYIYNDNEQLMYVAFETNPVFYNYLRGKSYTLTEDDGLRLTAASGSLHLRSASYNDTYQKYVYALSNVSYISDHYKQSGGGGGGGDNPTEPPTPWPDPPSNPVGGNPEVPGPGDPTVPTPPDPPNPWEPIPGIDINITGDDFQDLLDALNEHCIHLQTSIQDNISQLWSLQSELIESQMEWLGNDVIIASFTDLKDYLHELFEWLADQMQFDVNVEGGQYDDTSVIYWLKQIWGKLPTGINTRPTDPVTNPTGWWDWLTQLLNNLAADLMALGHDKLANLLEMLNQLRNKFPFSLPWDIAALLGLLVAVPECPEFDVPAYTIGSNMQLSEVGTYHITLEPYEGVWEGVKWIETLAFAVYLITHTGGLMDMVTKTVRPR